MTVQTFTPEARPAPKKAVQGEKLRGHDKVARIPIKNLFMINFFRQK